MFKRILCSRAGSLALQLGRGSPLAINRSQWKFLYTLRRQSRLRTLSGSRVNRTGCGPHLGGSGTGVARRLGSGRGVRRLTALISLCSETPSVALHAHWAGLLVLLPPCLLCRTPPCVVPIHRRQRAWVQPPSTFFFTARKRASAHFHLPVGLRWWPASTPTPPTSPDNPDVPNAGPECPPSASPPSWPRHPMGKLPGLSASPCDKTHRIHMVDRLHFGSVRAPVECAFHGAGLCRLRCLRRLCSTGDSKSRSTGRRRTSRCCSA